MRGSNLAEAIGDVRPKWHGIAERPGLLVPRAYVDACFHRYETAARWIGDRAVLEVACGAGQGLGFLGKTARRLVGGDYVDDNLRLAKSRYGAIPLVQLDAQSLPFRSASFDAVVMLGAVHMLAQPERFAAEAARVLASGGRIVMQSHNPLWRDFQPDRFGRTFLNSVELGEMVARVGFKVRVFGAFPTDRGMRSRTLSVLRHAAWSWRFMPRPGRVKNLLRRIAYGRLVPFPDEVVAGTEPYVAPVELSSVQPDTNHLYLYVMGELP